MLIDRECPDEVPPDDSAKDVHDQLYADEKRPSVG
jgi:hypothetical protein